MSLKVKMSKDQMQTGRLVVNGWYKGVITKVDSDEDKNGSTMYIPEVKITGHPEFAGCTLKAWMCPEWTMGGDIFRRFLEALLGKPYTPEMEIDLEAAKGKEVQFYNQQGAGKDGRPQNNIVDWKHKDATNN